ncbi:MAG: glucose-1-phosphate adenylyltransferase [Verrucomicrobia bacterium CG1_02_43_26]|nr:MAG: glucose-1-phosphate adenylyltransferase [Verrucomicrobia bacterium CG1_02_43_26]
MGGGRGSRLYPLTKLRCKPAVPLAGKYRLVDISISNCLNSGYNRIYLLSQFNTASMHRHVQDSYKFDPFGGGFVDILSAEQTEMSSNWYQGTADAVRQNMKHFRANDDDLFVILSGDQLYRMDLRSIVEKHRQSEAEVTISTTLVPKEQAHSFGIMKIRNDFSISEFIEKPQSKQQTDDLVINDHIKQSLSSPSTLGQGEYCLASMGIYVFNASTLKKALESDLADFGKEIIPSMIGKSKMVSYIFEGYWEDIGTIDAFFNANLMLTDTLPKFNFYDSDNVIYTHARYLPASKINNAHINHSIIAEGCIISKATLNRCVISVRSIIRDGSVLENVYMMGGDDLKTLDEKPISKNGRIPEVGIGENCRISNAIIDKNARIGNNVVLSPKGKPDHYEEGAVYVRDGVLIVTKNGIVPDGTVIA